jgi:4-hydroxy-3-polyprenylbenzoate decarboxylase
VLPKTLRIGLCQQIVKLGKDVSLSELPIPHCWPGESGPTMTSGVVHVAPLAASARHVGLCPVEAAGPDTLLLHWHSSDVPQTYFEGYLKSGRQMPVSISLGGDPLIPYVASLPLPDYLDPYLFAGLLRGGSVNLVKGRSVELEVPAEAEIIVEGYIDPVEPTGVGTVANGAGYLSRNERLPLMRVTGITHRANPVFPMLLRSAPPCEEHVHAQLTERLLLPLARLLAPEIVDLHLPLAGHADQILFASINKTSPMQGRRVMNVLWGLPVLSQVKLLVVVDADVDIRQPDAVWQRMSTHVHPQRDAVDADGPAGTDDHAAPVRGAGSKLGLDATAKLASEGHPRRWPSACTVSAEMAETILDKWTAYGLGEFPGPAPVG